MTKALDKWREAQGRRNRPPKPPIETPPEPLGAIYMRKKTRVPTPGSQRRCYDGCFPSSDWDIVWSSWEILSSHVPESKLQFWEELSAERGGTEYKWEPLEP